MLRLSAAIFGATYNFTQILDVIQSLFPPLHIKRELDPKWGPTAGVDGIFCSTSMNHKDNTQRTGVQLMQVFGKGGFHFQVLLNSTLPVGELS
jgi:hypothetical protein